ncbi:hypothetical protein KUCAC02_033332 [Chaenocephalus aceratus]|nr:hypothetical protein KUCAC02_033332 [Chaenocephalus aceratus]
MCCLNDSDLRYQRTGTHPETDGRNETATISNLIWYFLPTIVLVPPLGIPDNALVLRLLLGKPNICSTSEIFVLNLAVFDMMFCVMVVIEYFYFMFDKSKVNAHFLSRGLSQAGGPMLLCAISLDAFMAVCHPLIFLRLKEPKLRLSSCLLVNVFVFTACGLAKLNAVLHVGDDSGDPDGDHADHLHQQRPDPEVSAAAGSWREGSAPGEEEKRSRWCSRR